MELWKAQYVARVSKYRNRVAKLNKYPEHKSQLLVISVSLDLGQRDKKKGPSTNAKWNEQIASYFLLPFFIVDLFSLFFHVTFFLLKIFFTSLFSFDQLELLEALFSQLAVTRILLCVTFSFSLFYFYFLKKRHKTCNKNAARRCNLDSGKVQR